MMKAETIKNVLLIGHSFVYLIALCSIYWQIPGLYGEKGLIPVASKLSCDGLSCRSTGSGVNILPNIVNFFRIAPSYALQATVLFGIVLASSSVIFNWMRNSITYLSLFVIYSTIFQVGDVFLQFQWDLLLLESGALCIFIAPIPFIGYSSADNVGLYLMRWLSFRLMYSSGVVKLTSRCPVWWDLGALDIHFESQCIPTWIAYYAHLTPKWFKHFSTAFTLYIEIILPPLSLLPFKYARYYSCFFQVLLMILIMATGNYNFLNILISLHCVAILVDFNEFKFLSRGIFGQFVHSLKRWSTFISTVLIIITIYLFVRYFNIGIDGFKVTSSIAITPKQFDEFVEVSTIWFLYMGFIGFVAEIIISIIRFFANNRESKLRTLFHLGYVIIIGTLLFSISTVSFAVISKRAQAQIPAAVKYMYEHSKSLQLTHPYGLFRTMTGLHGRPEVIVEGSFQPDGPWIPFDFYAKPGKLDERPQFVFPHQPRLDWQMWFAALGAYQYNAFFISLTYHLLRNNSEVTYLMKKYPFEGKLPNYVRANLYLYHYTSIISGKKWPKNYWQRNFQEVYMPPITRDDPGISDYLEQYGFVLKEQFRLKNQNVDLEKKLRNLHNIVRTVNPATFVNSIFGAHIVVLLGYLKLEKYIKSLFF